MTPINAFEADYEKFEILGHEGLFTNLRIDRTTLPEGLYAYDLMDACDGNIGLLRDKVGVNHYGTCVLKAKIENSAEGVDITDDDYNFLGEEATLEEFKNESTDS